MLVDAGEIRHNFGSTSSSGAQSPVFISSLQFHWMIELLEDAISLDESFSMDLPPTLDDLAPEYKCSIGAYLPPPCLSHFRTVNLVHRHALQLTLFEVLAYSGGAGLEAIPKIAEVGNVGAITAVSARLEDADGGVRREAVYALGEIVEKGDAGAIPALAARLEDADCRVRSAAACAVGMIAVIGNARAITAVAARLEDADEIVRREAVCTLEEIAEKGNLGCK